MSAAAGSPGPDSHPPEHVGPLGHELHKEAFHPIQPLVPICSVGKGADSEPFICQGVHCWRAALVSPKATWLFPGGEYPEATRHGHLQGRRGPASLPGLLLSGRGPHMQVF